MGEKSRSNFSTGGGNMTDEQWNKMISNSDNKARDIIDKALDSLRNSSVNTVLKLTPIVQEKVKTIQEIAESLGIVQLQSEYIAYELYKSLLIKGYFLNKKEEFLK